MHESCSHINTYLLINVYTDIYLIYLAKLNYSFINLPRPSNITISIIRINTNCQFL